MTLGVFDGVHIGHQKILRQTVAWAKNQEGEGVVVTFDRHPDSIVRRQSPMMITSLRHRLHLFEQHGVDVCIVLQFDEALATMPAEDFVRDIIHGWIGAKGLIWGFDCRFGQGAKGDLKLLESLASRYHFQVCSIEPVSLNGVVVKSTYIRESILKGDFQTAAAMLGRPFSLLGTVVHGDHRGRTLGFPTANLNLHHETRPPYGVYSCRVVWNGKLYKALTSIGVRPTFQDGLHALRETVEVYLLDFDGDLYGKDIEVQFVRRLREERKFESPERLVAQMKIDRAQIQAEPLEILGHESAPSLPESAR